MATIAASFGKCRPLIHFQDTIFKPPILVAIQHARDHSDELLSSKENYDTYDMNIGTAEALADHVPNDPSAETSHATSHESLPDSDEESSVGSWNDAFRRVVLAPGLPSSSSSANIKALQKKLAASFPRRQGRRIDDGPPRARTHPSTSSKPSIHHVSTTNSRLDADSSYGGSGGSDGESEPSSVGSSLVSEEQGSGSGQPSLASESRHITQHWAQLRERRNILRNTLGNIGRERKFLRDLRQDKDEAYEDLRLALLVVLPKNSNLYNLFNRAQAADQSVQQAENGLEDLIDDLEEGEIQLELEERRFFTTIALGDESSEEDDTRPPSRFSLRGINESRPEDVHPLFGKLQDAVRELQLTKEFLFNLDLKKRSLEVRQVDGLSKDDEDYLVEYGSLREQADSAVQHWTDETVRLDRECRDKDVIPRHSPFQQEGYALNPGFWNDIVLEEPSPDERRHVKTLAHPRFSYLLSNPSHLLSDPPETAEAALRKASSLPQKFPGREQFIQAAKKEFGIETLLTYADHAKEHDVVNRWLLQKLRESPMEIDHMSNAFRSATRLEIRDVERWQRDVLFFWARDNAAISDDTTPAPPVAYTTLANAGTAYSPRGSSHSSLPSLNEAEAASSPRSRQS